ncbi:MAG TPA: hypothetical protein DCO75_11285, partial [Fibrobacteres bacterium]|nr:hypothetical protein [Fibrobacterota bacterium]
MKIGLLGLTRKRRTITVILSVLLGITATLIIIGFIPFSNKGIKNNIESVLKESMHGSLTIDKMTIALWTGITLENVHYSQNGDRGESVSCVLPRISVSYYLLPIVFKHLIVKNIRLEQPEITLELSSAKSLPKEAGKGFSFDDLNRVLETIPYTVIIRNISVVDAHTVVVLDNRQAVDCKGMNLSMNVGLKRGLSLEGHLTFSESEFFRTLRVSRLKMSVRIKDMEAEVDNCHSYLYGGNLSINGNVNLAGAYLNKLSLSLENFKLDDWYHSTGIGQGNLTGKVDAKMNLAPGKLNIDSLSGKGWVKMTNVGAHGIPLQKNLLVLLVIPKLSEMKFSRITSDLA